MANVKAGVVLAVGAGLALAAGLRHAATEYPADKELGPWSSYFSLNSQVKLVRNPSYRTYPTLGWLFVTLRWLRAVLDGR